MRTVARVAVIAGLLAGLAPTASATPLLLNGGFEDATAHGSLPADFAFWTVNSVDGLYPQIGVPHTGSNSVSFGGPEVDSVSQTFATDAGQFYAISFWLADTLVNTCPGPLSSCDAQFFAAYWNGTPILELSGFVQAFPYTQFTFVVPASGPSSTLRFSGGNIPGFFYVDDASVAAVPEPASLTLVAGGLAALFARRRGRKPRR